jgi:hypothetical protein
VAEDDTKSGGQVTANSLKRQLDVLNKAYKPHNIHFIQVGVDSWIKPKWAGNCEEMEMKDKLRNGNYAEMDVYIFPRIRCVRSMDYGEYSEVLGSVSELPLDVEVGSFEFNRDGVHIRADTMPGGANTQYNEGMTLVHEVGHWLGCEYRPPANYVL